MYKRGLVFAFSSILAGCATAQTETAQKQVCVTETEEATGTRVETETVCRPARPNE